MVCRSEVSIYFFVTGMVIHLRCCLLFLVVSICFVALVLTSFVFLPLSSSLSTRMGVLIFLLCWVPFSASDLCIGAKWMILVSLRCQFPSDLSNCSMMALTFVASVFRDYCFWSFLGLLTLTQQWMLDLQLDWLSRRLGGDLVMVKVFFVLFEVVSMYGCVGYQVMNQSKYCGINWVLCRMDYSAYRRWTSCGVYDKCDNDCVNGVWWLYRC